MNTANIWKEKVRKCSAFLIFLSLWLMAPAVWAAHEVNIGDITADVELGKLTKWTDNLVVRWKTPTMGTDILNGYLYKWNESSASLNETDGLFADFSATGYGEVGAAVDPPNVVKDKADLTNLDSGNVLYLHVITSYLDVANGTGARVSADTVYGPFLIDNKAPVGTVRIVDGAGNDIATTSGTTLNLQFSAAKDPATMYLSETGNKPATGAPYSTEAVWALSDTTPGLKTISAWFEDSVGNLSQIATDSVTLLSSISISPNTATLDLAAGATQVFRVEGTDAAYTWTIIDAVPEKPGDTVAQITVGGTATNSVTVQGLAKGTFKLQAVPSSGTGDTLTSGTITVAQSTRTNTITLATGWNWVSFNTLPAAAARSFSAFFGSNEVLVQQVKTQTASATNTGSAWLGDASLMDRISQGAMFKIKVSNGFTLTVTGTPIEASTPVTLNNGWTWIAFLPNTDMSWDNAVAGVMSKLVQIKSQTQSKTNTGSSFIGDLSTMFPGKGYVIKTNAVGSLIYPNQ